MWANGLDVFGSHIPPFGKTLGRLSHYSVYCMSATGRPFFNAIYFVLVALPMWVNNEVGLRVASKKSRCGLQTMS